MHHKNTQSFAELLQSAVEELGTLSAAYQQFHAYSLGNQLLAMFQCQKRGLCGLGRWPRSLAGKSWGATSARARRR